MGPKGLFALERLAHHATLAGAAIDVDAYEPHPAPGAGPVYDPSQPAYLRMNLAADRLDLWVGGSAAVPPDERLSFSAWRPDPGGDPYPPRALVGRYLADGLARVLRRLPAGMRVTIVPEPVRSVGAEPGGGWVVTAPAGRAAVYDAVLLTIGHGTAESVPEQGPGPPAVPRIARVFPVGGCLSPEAVPAGARVAVRGFALTFIDAALALSEGRGGGFAPRPRGHLPRYLPSPADSGPILPFSRTGRPMLAKADPEVASARPGVAAAVEEGAARMAGLPGVFRLSDGLLPVVAATADGCLGAAVVTAQRPERRRRSAEAITAHLAQVCEGRAAPVADPVARMRRALEVAVGRRDPDPPWALAQTWQGLYPRLVERLGGTGLAAGDWPAFLRLAAEMERLAFGPPPVNAAKLLALIDAGRIDPAHVRGGRLTTTGSVTSLVGDGATPVDIVVDAVSAPPGAVEDGGGPLAGLLAAGRVRVAPGRRGIEVAADATCVRRGGGRAEGLAAIGRATEDWVVGNDTLNRALHGHPDRWARAVVARAPRLIAARA